MFNFLFKYSLFIACFSIILVGLNFITICLYVIKKKKILKSYPISIKNRSIDIDSELIEYIIKPDKKRSKRDLFEIIADGDNGISVTSTKNKHIDISQSMNIYATKERIPSVCVDVLTNVQKDLLKKQMFKCV